MISQRNEPVPFNHLVNFVLQIWKRNFLQFKRSWLLSLFWILIEPLFILGAIGFGLGSFISTIQGVSYVEFFYPALICSSSMFISYFVSTYDNFSKMTHQQLFSSFILSPIEPREIVLGEVLWAASKGTMSAAGVSLIAFFLGLIDTWRIFPALAVVFISCVVFSAFGMLITTYVKNFDQIIYPSSGFIIPMSLFCGTYFPLEQLPYGLRYLMYLLPLTNSVRAVRALMISGFDGWIFANVLYLLVLAYLFIRWSTARLSSRILN